MICSNTKWCQHVLLWVCLMVSPLAAASARVVTYSAPKGIDAAPDFHVSVDGRELFVYNSKAAAFASFSFEGKVCISIVPSKQCKHVDIRPLSCGIRPSVVDNTITFDLNKPANLSVELNRDIKRPLFLFASPPEKNVPRPGQPGVRCFAGGTIHEVGEITLADNETLYIAGGAIVRGTVRAKHAKNVRIAGRGILDATSFPKKTSLVRFTDCDNVEIEGIIAFNGWGWTLVPTTSRNVRFDNVKVIGWRDNDDGIDIVGCNNLTVDNCFLRTKDDCLAIKASPAYFKETESGLRDVHDVEVLNTVFWNAEWGNAIEIGFELQTSAVRDILFKNCDIIHVERGGVFTIHNGDFATVENIRYEDIRAEDVRDKLLDFHVGLSIYSADCPWEYHRKNPQRKRNPGGPWMSFTGKKFLDFAAKRGCIHHVSFHNIDVMSQTPPPSYLVGYDEKHGVEDVVFENFRIHGKPIRNTAEGNIAVKHASGIRFRNR